MNRRLIAVAACVSLVTTAACSLQTNHALERIAETFAAQRWGETIALSKSVLIKDPSISMARYYLGLSYLHMFSPALAKGELELFMADMEAGTVEDIPETAVGSGRLEPGRTLRARAMAGIGAANVLLGLLELSSEDPNRDQAAECFRTGRNLCRRAYNIAPADPQVRIIIERYVAAFGIMDIPRLQQASTCVADCTRVSFKQA